jgi:hypothetical protein
MDGLCTARQGVSSVCEHSRAVQYTSRARLNDWAVESMFEQYKTKAPKHVGQTWGLSGRQAMHHRCSCMRVMRVTLATTLAKICYWGHEDNLLHSSHIHQTHGYHRATCTSTPLAVAVGAPCHAPPT